MSSPATSLKSTFSHQKHDQNYRNYRQLFSTQTPELRTEFGANAEAEAPHPTPLARQRRERVKSTSKVIIFSRLTRRCARSQPSCLFAALFAQKSVPKIGKICTILGAICNLNMLNTLWPTGRFFWDFSTKTLLSILTT